MRHDPVGGNGTGFTAPLQRRERQSSSKFHRDTAHKRTPFLPEPLERRALLSRILHVDWQDHNADAANDGSSWQAAFVGLQPALAAAAAGDEIRIADGTYTPTSSTDRNATFSLKSGVALYGGYAGHGAEDPDARDTGLYATVLSGNIGSAALQSDNSYNVVTAANVGATTVLDGVTVTAGYASTYNKRRGAGMYLVSSAPRVVDCRFSGNTSATDYGEGGGLCNIGSSPSLIDCVFDGNTAAVSGGGVYNDQQSVPRIINCVFMNNSATTWSGGAIYSQSSAGGVLTDCTFASNSAKSYGGAIFSSSSSPEITNCVFRGNSAASGGAVASEKASSPRLANCTFSGNSASNLGSCVHATSDASPVLTNCTFIGNSAMSGGAVYVGKDANVANCILWANGPFPLWESGAGLAVRYSLIEGGFPGEGNIDANPCFVDADGPDNVFGTADDDLRQRPNSPAVDAGDNLATELADITTDIAGGPRFLDVPTSAKNGLGMPPIVDMGAYEATAALAATAGGPYAVVEGGSIVLTGRAASDQTGELSYAWDLDNDGEFDDATGPAPTFSAAVLAWPQVVTIGLKVTDAAGRNATDATAITVIAALLHVDASATGAGTGLSWADAFPDLQPALRMAVAGCEIRVAGGTYRPTGGTDRNAAFVIPTGIALLGGFTGAAGADPGARDVAACPTVLSGDIGLPGNTNDNSFHVVIARSTDASTLLEGLTITAGSASSSGASRNRGGGMLIVQGAPTLRDCSFSTNYGSTGGGVYCDSEARPTFINCVFSGNSADTGGGVYGQGPILLNCTFRGNSATSIAGGGLTCGSAARITNCVFSGNAAINFGGAIRVLSGSPLFTNCTINGNSATDTGSAIATVAAASPTLVNCIIWGNASPGPQLAGGSPVVRHSLVQGGFAGPGNLDVDPWFVDADGADGVAGTADDDLRLRPFSTAVDAGDGTDEGLAGVVVDLAGNTRFINVPTSISAGLGGRPMVDMGAYEAVAAFGAVAGGPYEAIAGQPLVLRALASSDQAGPLAYAWDFDGDGLYQDAEGPTPAFSTAGVTAPRTVQVILRVTDSLGREAFDTAIVRVAPQIIFVDDSAAGANTGGNWTDAFIDLQSALAAALPGCEIRIASGVYRPAAGLDRSATFLLRNGITLLGGYAGAGSADPDARNPLAHASILSGDIGEAGNSADNSYHVLRGSQIDASVVISGLTISGGNANGTAVEANGGGIYLDLSSVPAFIDCIFLDNSATNGGAMCNHSSSPTLIRCTFSGNSAGAGGGMYNSGKPSAPNLTNCTFSGNSAAGNGGGMYNASALPVLVDCTFSGNSAGTGGGMANWGSAAPRVTGCIFSGNSATLNGGGIGDYYATTRFAHCTFIGNTAAQYGGGIWADALSTDINQCAFNGNSAGQDGGGLYCISNSRPAYVTDSRFTGNSATRNGGGICAMSGSLPLSNCIFTGNQAASGGGVYTGANASAYIKNCVLAANRASTSGGGIHGRISTLINCAINGNSAGSGGGVYTTSLGRVSNCTFTGNSASSAGGGLYVTNASGPLQNCTFTGNSAASGSAVCKSGGTLALTNCILWGNGSNATAGTLTITHSVVENGFTGTANVNADPQFTRTLSWGDDGLRGTADDDYGDLRVAGVSPCIDAGNSSALGTDAPDMDGDNNITETMPLDFDGRPRLAGTAVDIGAFELHTAATPVTWPCSSSVDVLYLRCSADGQSLQVWAGSAPAGTPSRTYPIGSVSAFIFAARDSVDVVYVDYANGDPLPAGGLTVTGAEADRIILVNLPADAPPEGPVDVDDNELVVRVDETSRQAMLDHLRSMLAARTVTSSAADSTHGLGLAIDGQGDLLLKLRLHGDMDGNGKVDGDDFFAMDRAFLMQNAADPQGDWTNDGRVDGADYVLIDHAFLQLTAPAPAATAGQPAAPAVFGRVSEWLEDPAIAL